MTGTEAIAYIHGRSWLGSRPGLTRMYELLERMGNPERQLKFVHVAGTNGKGSTAAMLASVLKEAGYRVGLHTSPYIHRFHERIQINGTPISDRDLGAATELTRPHAEAMTDRPTEFELVTAVAIVHFLWERCDIVVMEVGLGGRLDATNVIGPPEAAVITNIGLDHMQQLGDTVEAIAREKAGIIKPGCDAVLYPQQRSVEEVFQEVCRRQNACLHRVKDSPHLVSRGLSGQVFDYGGLQNLVLSLLGDHQLQNAAVTVETVRVLAARGWAISEDALRAGLANTRWPGRFEVLCREPVFLVDGGHNPQCAQAMAANLDAYFPGAKVILLAGVLADKDYPGLFDLIAPYVREFIATAPESPRAVPAEELADFLAQYRLPVRAAASVEEGAAMALAAAGPRDIVLAMGSLYLVGAVRDFFGLSDET